MSNIKPEILEQIKRDPPTLTSLSLFDHNLDDTDMVTLMEALAKNTTLTSINLSTNKLGPIGVAELTCHSRLTSLDLSDNQIGDKGAMALANIPLLTSLNVSHNRISHEGAVALASNTLLRVLDISANELELPSIKAFANNRHLLSLSINNNRIKKEGAAAIVKNTCLTYLDISFNQIGDEGAKVFANNSNLFYLNLCGNEIGDEGAKALAKNTHLSTLRLSSNQIGNLGAKAFLTNFYLTDLTIWGNKVEVAIEEEVDRAITLNEKAKELQFIESAIVIAQGARQKQNSASLYNVPNDILLIILAYVAFNTGCNPKEVTLVCGFILRTLKNKENWHTAVQRGSFFKVWNTKERENVLRRYPVRVTITENAATASQLKRASLYNQEISLDESKNSCMNMF